MTRAFWVLLKREIGALLLSPIAYVLFVCMSVVLGFTFLVCVEWIDKGFRQMPLLGMIFSTFQFWISLIVLCPILTMRLFSDEYKSGTIEALLTAPVTEWDVVLSKFFSSVTVYTILLSPSALCLAVFQLLTHNQVPLVWGPVVLTYSMLFLVGMFWLSIGVFASSLTRNQIIAAIISFTGIAILFFIGMLVYMISESSWKEMLEYFFTYQHVTTFGQGLFDSRPVVFYLSGTLFFLTLTQRVLAYRRFSL